jgi:hypothetical protein
VLKVQSFNQLVNLGRLAFWHQHRPAGDVAHRPRGCERAFPLGSLGRSRGCAHLLADHSGFLSAPA